MIQLDRTLDEAYYPGLSPTALARRNRDQVVNREWPWKIKTDDVTENPGLILMVPNLWIWRLGNMVVSAYSTEPYRGDDSLRFRRGASIFEACGLMIRTMIEEHILRFGELQPNNYPSPLDIFETSVHRILSDVDIYMHQNIKAKLEIKVEREFMHRLADLRDELAMIREVLTRKRFFET